MLKRIRLYTKRGEYVTTAEFLPGFEKAPVVMWGSRFFVKDPAGNMRETVVGIGVGQLFEPEVQNLGETCESF